MNSHVALGFVVGLFVATLFALSVLTRFVSSDLDGFRRWLDRSES